MLATLNNRKTACCSQPACNAADSTRTTLAAAGPSPPQQPCPSQQPLTLLVLDLLLDVLNGVAALHLQRDGLASQRLHKDLHATAQAQHQVQGGLLLDVVVSQGAAVLQLLAGEDQALLVGGDA